MSQHSKSLQICNLVNVSFRWFQLGTNPYTGSQDWIYSGGYFNRNYQDLPDIYWLPASLHPSPLQHAVICLEWNVENLHTHFTLIFIPLLSSSSFLSLKRQMQPAQIWKTLNGGKCPSLHTAAFRCFFHHLHHSLILVILWYFCHLMTSKHVLSLCPSIV